MQAAHPPIVLQAYPYSLKLLWSPIVDSLFSESFGRRKSWIIPIQAGGYYRAEWGLCCGSFGFSFFGVVQALVFYNNNNNNTTASCGRAGTACTACTALSKAPPPSV
jgi:hypothetical protein